MSSTSKKTTPLDQLAAQIRVLESTKSLAEEVPLTLPNEPSLDGPKTVNILAMRVPHTNVFQHVESFPRSYSYGDAVYFRMRPGYFEEKRDQPGPGRAYIYAVKTSYSRDKYDVVPITKAAKEDDVACLVVNKSLAASKVMGWNLFQPEQEDAQAAVDAAKASARKAQDAAKAAKVAEDDAKAAIQAMQAVVRADEEAVVEAATQLKKGQASFWQRSATWLGPVLYSVAAAALFALAAARWEAESCDAA